MVTSSKAIASLARCITVMVGLFLMLLQASCSYVVDFPDSPDGRFSATLVRDGANAHYEVREIETGRLILTTHAQYWTPNDVKAGGFSSDSKKFAAVYHYGHEGEYTWIGVWDTETGEFLYSKKKRGCTTSLAGVFRK
jgi:hypothetical protein